MIKGVNDRSKSELFAQLEKIQSPHSIVTQRGKNWYVIIDNCEITVNRHSFTIITAHKLKKRRSDAL